MQKFCQSWFKHKYISNIDILIPLKALKVISKIWDSWKEATVDTEPLWISQTHPGDTFIRTISQKVAENLPAGRTQRPTSVWCFMFRKQRMLSECCSDPELVIVGPFHSEHYKHDCRDWRWFATDVIKLHSARSFQRGTRGSRPQKWNQDFSEACDVVRLRLEGYFQTAD